MLDIKPIRENPELVKANLMKRGNPDNTSRWQIRQIIHGARKMGNAARYKLLECHVDLRAG